MDHRLETAYERMMEKALADSSSERKRRLLEKAQAEKTMLANVWWPAVGHLDDLHPEYGLVYVDEAEGRIRDTKRLWALGNYSKFEAERRIEARLYDKTKAASGTLPEAGFSVFVVDGPYPMRALHYKRVVLY